MSAAQGGPTTVELEQLRGALNLGWSMAELRGRIRYGHVEPPGTVDYQFPREEFHALPIGGEHSLVEQQIATRVAVGLLADRFALNEPLPQRKESPPETIKALAMDLERKLEAAEKGSAHVRPDAYPAGSEVGKAWEAAAEAIYYWDEQIQDGLGVSAELLAAYQLGRDPERKDEEPNELEQAAQAIARIESGGVLPARGRRFAVSLTPPAPRAVLGHGGDYDASIS